MGKWKAIIPLALALVIASSVTIFVYRWLKVQSTPKETSTTSIASSKTAPIVVAVQGLTWGTKLEPKLLKTVPYLKDTLPPGSFSNPELVTNRVLISSLKPNEPILESKLAPSSVTTGGISVVVTPGKRALALKGDKLLGLSGMIRPTNRVDILLTTTNPWSNEKTTKTVFENIHVLATGVEMRKNKEDGKPYPVDVYTLEVTPKEGEELVLASSMGKLQFALRNITDKEIVLTNGASPSNVIESFRPKKNLFRPEKNELAKRIRTVEIIEGVNVTQKNFEL
ncbi:MAG: Flp pilus assembly protein CpaB [Thermodesulfobacteriota bacterium]|nr:Flp pilus assembly protein CpaB [Thermodesulfobacteriota bacterium]